MPAVLLTRRDQLRLQARTGLDPFEGIVREGFVAAVLRMIRPSLSAPMISFTH
jgi:hypothetical protein